MSRRRLNCVPIPSRWDLRGWGAAVTFFEPPASNVFQIGDKARRLAQAKHKEVCSGCGSIEELGTTDRELIVCVGCFGRGGFGFAWHRN